MRRIYLPLLVMALVSLVFGVLPLGQPSTVYAATTTALYPGTVATTAAAPYDDFDWETPANVNADDGAYAIITSNDFDAGIYSWRLDATNFNCQIPDGATIDGIVLEFERSDAKSDDALVQLLKAGALAGNSKSVGVTWPATDTIATYGTSSDLWGTSWTVAEINASGFGVAVAAVGNANNAEPQIDFLRITVYYTPPPTVTGITPSKGTTDDTALSVTINGANFVDDTGLAAEINFNGSDAITGSSVTFVSSTEITATFDLSGVTTNLGAAWDVKVTNPDAQTGTGDNLFTIYRPDPTVSTITPDTGENTGSVNITDLAGTNFVNGSTSVKLAKGVEDDIAGTSVVVIATKITCTFDLTGAAAGAWDVVVTVAGAESSATLAAGFDVTTSALPSITNGPDNKDFGVLAEGATGETVINFFTVTNNSGYPVNITISGTDLTGGTAWTLADTPGEDIYSLKAGLDDDDDLFDIIVKKSSPNFLVEGLANSAAQSWGLKIWAPTTFTGGGENSGTVTLTAAAA